MGISDKSGFPVSIHLASATPHEISLVEKTLASRLTTNAPIYLVGDKAYDSNPLDRKLLRQGTELIAPHKANRVSAPTQDGRKLRRYKRRWKIERLFAWLKNYRRLVTRCKTKAINFLGFIYLAVMLILLRKY